MHKYSKYAIYRQKYSFYFLCFKRNLQSLLNFTESRKDPMQNFENSILKKGIPYNPYELSGSKRILELNYLKKQEEKLLFAQPSF